MMFFVKKDFKKRGVDIEVLYSVEKKARKVYENEDDGFFIDFTNKELLILRYLINRKFFFSPKMRKIKKQSIHNLCKKSNITSLNGKGTWLNDEELFTLRMLFE